MQRTLKQSCTFEGHGLHTGAYSKVSLSPAKVNAGICFFKFGQPISLTPVSDSRCSAIGSSTETIQTVEHLLASIYGLGISNLHIDVHGSEIPAMDGSAKFFTDLFLSVGMESQGVARQTLKIKKPLFIGEPFKAISLLPADGFSVSYHLDYPHPQLKNQHVEFEITPENFIREIAPARTFCTQDEADTLRMKGFGLGASTQNTLVMSEVGPIENTLRFPLEPARHKILDILGDLALANFFIEGRVMAIRSGHSLNQKLVQTLKNIRE